MLAALVAGAAVVAVSNAGAATPPTPAGWSRAVTQICAGAVLFEGTHQIGTRAGAIAVSRDIRSTGGRRVGRVDALAKPPLGAELVARWIAVERRLVATYASSYLRIWYAIERANTPAQRARLPRMLAPLLHAPDALQAEAQRFEQLLQVPDCTGGIQPPPPSGDLGAGPGT